MANHNAEYDIENNSSYLESRLMGALVEKGIVDKPKTRIFYDPENFGEGYRNFRRVIIDYGLRPIAHNVVPLSIVGLAGAASVIYFYPDAVASIPTAKGLTVAGVAGLVGKVLNIDEIFDQTPGKIAKRVFRNNRRPWREAYDKLTIKTKRELDRYMIMAQNPEMVSVDYGDRKNAQALGISIAKIADVLSATRADPETIRGFTLENLLEMFKVQKIGDDNTTKTIYGLLDKYPVKTLAKMIRSGDKSPGMDVLFNVAKNYELTLFISRAGEIAHLGTKLSRGQIFVEEDLGPKAGSYLGEYSKGKDIPRIGCGDDAAQQFMNRASRGFGYVGGDVEQGLMDSSTGGLVIVRGRIDGEVAKGMDDSTYPAVIFCLGGITHKLKNGSIKNGFIASLNRDRNLNLPPEYFWFRDGEMEHKTIEDDEHSTRNACNKAYEYLMNWQPRVAA